jgi:hypothetical protein
VCIADLKERPFMMRFGPRECHAKLAQPKDRKVFLRVCGNKYGGCPRVEHNLMQESIHGLKGFYETAQTQKNLDGKLHTFQSIKDRNAGLLEEK